LVSSQLFRELSRGFIPGIARRAEALPQPIRVAFTKRTIISEAPVDLYNINKKMQTAKRNRNFVYIAIESVFFSVDPPPIK
jgi:hypothetical protein